MSKAQQAFLVVVLLLDVVSSFSFQSCQHIPTYHIPFPRVSSNPILNYSCSPISDFVNYLYRYYHDPLFEAQCLKQISALEVATQSLRLLSSTTNQPHQGLLYLWLDQRSRFTINPPNYHDKIFVTTARLSSPRRQPNLDQHQYSSLIRFL